MKLSDIDCHPEKASKTVTLTNGELVLLRPLRKDDARLLGQYFLDLSAETKNLYGPHPFDQATADALCDAVNSADTLRMLCVSESASQERIIAYFILIFGIRGKDRLRYDGLGIRLDDRADCTLAPSVADAYQNSGLGSHIMEHLLEVASRVGRKRLVLWSGTRAHNKRAIHFYRKFGFRKVGEFDTAVKNFDMIAEIG